MTRNWMAASAASSASLSCAALSESNSRNTRIRLTSDVALSRPSAALPNNTADTSVSPSAACAAVTKSDRTTDILAGNPSRRATLPSIADARPRAPPPMFGRIMARGAWAGLHDAGPLLRRLVLAQAARRAGGVGKRRKLLLLIGAAAAGLDHARAHQQLRGILDRYGKQLGRASCRERE